MDTCVKTEAQAERTERMKWWSGRGRFTNSSTASKASEPLLYFETLPQNFHVNFCGRAQTKTVKLKMKDTKSIFWK